MNFFSKLTSVTLLSFSAISSPSTSYKQEIKIHTTSVPDSNSPTSACFVTTDLFDSTHCTFSDTSSFGSSSVYDKGPKNWRLIIKPCPYATKYFKNYEVEADISCANFSGRTPQESGRLDIYVATADISYPDFFNKLHYVYKFMNCRTTWTPATGVVK